MEELILYIAIAICSGILVGLLPGLNIWTPMLLIIPFANWLPIWAIVLIWLGTSIGSQYFGSVSAILCKVPGEGSSLVYINDINKINRDNRINLVYVTAVGSFFASIIALLLLFWLNSYLIDLVKLVSTNWVKLGIYLAIITFLVFSDKNVTISTILLIVGLVLAPKSDQTLPLLLYTLDDWTYFLTPSIITVGLLVIPDLFNRSIITDGIIKQYRIDTNIKIFHWYPIIRGTIVGLVGGLIPGQNASISSLLAHRLESILRRPLFNKVVAAESADNSAVIMGALPLTSLGLPTTISTMILVSLLTTKLFLMPGDANKPLIYNLNFLELVFYAGIVFSITFFLLNILFTNIYVHILEFFLANQRVFIIFIISIIIVVDMYAQQQLTLLYFAWFLFFAWVGELLSRHRISPLPLLFGFFLGNEIFWTVGYFIRLYT